MGSRSSSGRGRDSVNRHVPRRQPEVATSGGCAARSISRERERRSTIGSEMAPLPQPPVACCQCGRPFFLGPPSIRTRNRRSDDSVSPHDRCWCSFQRISDCGAEDANCNWGRLRESRSRASGTGERCARIDAAWKCPSRCAPRKRGRGARRRRRLGVDRGNECAGRRNDPRDARPQSHECRRAETDSPRWTVDQRHWFDTRRRRRARPHARSPWWQRLLDHAPRTDRLDRRRRARRRRRTWRKGYWRLPGKHDRKGGRRRHVRLLRHASARRGATTQLQRSDVGRDWRLR